MSRVRRRAVGPKPVLKTQLQTYRLPWPFASREYLVRCVDVPQGKTSHQAHCSSIDDHPSAPVRPDRVRGRAELVRRARGAGSRA